MKTLLVINASGRVTRSITRRLTRCIADAWSARHPDGAVVHRDVGLNPLPTVDEHWIAAAFAQPAGRTESMRQALRLSESLIEELAGADAVVLGAPIYNFGMPASLKAYFDQIVRVGRTFVFHPEASEPYQPLLSSKPVVVVTAAGDGAMFPGGSFHSVNFLEPHLETVLGFIGLSDLTFVRVGYEESQDDRLKQSLAAAESAIDELAARLSSAATANESDFVGGGPYAG